MFIKRFLDIFFCLSLIPFVLIPMIIIAVIIRLTSPGPALHWSKRVGQNNKIFLMPKFRSMHLETPDVATHLLQSPDSYLTKVGKFLRKTSLDELPQMMSILKGDMSFVGPRPALFNQDDLIELRTQKGVHHIKPGVTGWAQVNGRDNIPIPQKVDLDYYYLNKKSLAFDFVILMKTVQRVLSSANVSH